MNQRQLTNVRGLPSITQHSVPGFFVSALEILPRSNTLAPLYTHMGDFI